jgi:protoporphyrinogen oxidase
VRRAGRTEPRPALERAGGSAPRRVYTGRMRCDAVVLGAGPAGLGAALVLAGEGREVVVLDAAPAPGGLSVTRRRDGFAYDLGGHIPFVRDPARLAWLRDLLGDDLRWVPRPVSCVLDGRVTRGRYLDQRPPVAAPEAVEGHSAAAELCRRFGRAWVDAVMRPYLEKVDGLPLERIPAERALRLMEDQAAPEGFWFPAHGIGQLIDAMAGAVAASGGRILLEHRATAITTRDGAVRSVAFEAGGGGGELETDAVVVAIPAGVAIGLLRPKPAALPGLRMRATCLVCLEIGVARVSDEAWVQVDDPRVPFARAFEPANWSADLAPPGRTMLGLECYCAAEPGDPVWGLSDGALAERCAAALADPLRWIADPGLARPIEVLRVPAAYPQPDIDQMARLAAATRSLEGIAGLQLAPGPAVIEAIEQGERAAAAVLDRPRAPAPASGP